MTHNEGIFSIMPTGCLKIGEMIDKAVELSLKCFNPTIDLFCLIEISIKLAF